jgi:hypothetical protein
MAVLHRAWSFDASALATRLDGLLGQGPKALRRAASAAFDDAGEETLRTLADLRFEPAWLAPDEGGDSRDEEQAAVLLAAAATPLPSLSRSFAAGHLALRIALPDLGWSRERIELLVRGRPLVELFPVGSARRWELSGLDQYGGYLSRGDVEALARELERAADDASPVVLSRLAPLAHAHRLTPETVLSRALADAREMLATARSRGADVLSILD